MIYVLIYIVTAIISSLTMFLAVCIRSRKINPNDTVPSKEVSFLFLSFGAMLIPGLNLIVSIYYLYRVLSA